MARAVEAALQPHTSMAAVALANGINANMLRRWVRDSMPTALPKVAPDGCAVSQAPVGQVCHRTRDSPEIDHIHALRLGAFYSNPRLKYAYVAANAHMSAKDTRNQSY